MKVLARGPWDPSAVAARWRTDAYEPDPRVAAAADEALAELAARGSPSHDSVAARLASFTTEDGGLQLELQPVRWALRLVEGAASGSLFVLCAVRDPVGRWLAGRRSPWLAILPGTWHLGAAGSVGAGDDPVAAIRQELEEEWGLRQAALTVAALLEEPSGRTLVLAVAQTGDEPRPNDEHDRWAWWPADPAAWPAEAGAELRELAHHAVECLVEPGREGLDLEVP
jgi:8-oxo-dGTP diphosphatase